MMKRMLKGPDKKLAWKEHKISKHSKYDVNISSGSQ